MQLILGLADSSPSQRPRFLTIKGETKLLSSYFESDVCTQPHPAMSGRCSEQWMHCREYWLLWDRKILWYPIWDNVFKYIQTLLYRFDQSLVKQLNNSKKAMCKNRWCTFIWIWLIIRQQKWQSGFRASISKISHFLLHCSDVKWSVL